jgi:hypothetical protein
MELSMRHARISLTACAIFACISTTWAAGPYSAGLRQQPVGLPTNAILGFRLAVGNTGAGLVGSIGSAYAFAPRPDGTALFGQTLSSGVTDDLYGLAVAVASPQTLGSFAAVGAYGDDTFALNSGKVYMYRLQASLSTPYVAAGVLEPPTPSAAGNFGYSVAVDGNFAFVGEVKAINASSQQAGAVHIFENTGGATWELRTTLRGAPTDGATARFGHALAVSGTTVLIGSPNAVESGFNTAGAAYIWVRSGGGATLQSRLALAGDAQADDELGAAVDIDGDTVILGSARDDKVVGVDAGSAYIFNRTAGSWQRTTRLFSSAATPGNLFGAAVSVSGAEAMVGAYCQSGGSASCTGPGAVELFQRNSAGVWSGTQRILAPDGLNGEAFGGSVAQAKPGNRLAFAGAFRAGPVTGQGALYVLRGDDLFSDGFE